MNETDKNAVYTPPSTLPLVRRIARLPIVLYRLTLSRVMGGQCRYQPTCSMYGLQAVDQHGAFKGWWMALARICRCHPLRPGGYDPVPPACTAFSRTPPSTEDPSSASTVPSAKVNTSA